MKTALNLAHVYHAALVADAAYLISLFLFRGFVGYAVVTVFLGTVIVLSKVPLRYIVRGNEPAPS